MQALPAGLRGSVCNCQRCDCFTIVSSVNCSGKMSVHEGRDFEPARASKTPVVEQRAGVSTGSAPGGGDYGNQRTSVQANSGGPPEGRSRRTGPWQSRPQAPQQSPLSCGCCGGHPGGRKILRHQPPPIDRNAGAEGGHSLEPSNSKLAAEPPRTGQRQAASSSQAPGTPTTDAPGGHAAADDSSHHP